jgi:S1-C subfamily serine protease
MARFLLAVLALCALAGAARADLSGGVAAFNQQRYAEAMRELLPLARQGDANAQWAVGIMYFAGHGVAEDRAEGCRWFRRSAEQGSAPGEYFFGNCYELGVEIQRSEREAVAWYRKSAKQGFAEAEAALGAHYIAGLGVKRNEATGIEWLQKSAAQGASFGMNLLCRAYRDGTGVARDRVQAFAWCRLAVDHAASDKMRGVYQRDLDGVAARLSPAERARGERIAAAWQPASPAGAGRGKAKSPLSIQEALIGALDDLGYDAGPPRKRLDARAKAAIRAFQRDHGLPESGRLSKKLVAAVRDALERKHGPGAVAEAPSGATGPLRLYASGSGFVVSEAGHVLTNRHVVQGCREMRVGDKEPVEVVAISDTADFALLKLRHPRPSVATFRDGASARPGEDIVVLGYPLHGLLGSDPIVTTGTINALAGIRDDRSLIQISAPVQPGNSGGPVLDASGNVVGVVVSGLSGLAIAKATGGALPENVNFAINEATARRFLDSQHVRYKLAPSAVKLAAPDIAGRASEFTLLLECFK